MSRIRNTDSKDLDPELDPGGHLITDPPDSDPATLKKKLIRRHKVRIRKNFSGEDRSKRV